MRLVVHIGHTYSGSGDVTQAHRCDNFACFALEEL